MVWRHTPLTTTPIHPTVRAADSSARPASAILFVLSRRPICRRRSASFDAAPTADDTKGRYSSENSYAHAPRR